MCCLHRKFKFYSMRITKLQCLLTCCNHSGTCNTPAFNWARMIRMGAGCSGPGHERLFHLLCRRLPPRAGRRALPRSFPYVAFKPSTPPSPTPCALSLSSLSSFSARTEPSRARSAPHRSPSSEHSASILRASTFPNPSTIFPNPRPSFSPAKSTGNNPPLAGHNWSCSKLRAAIDLLPPAVSPRPGPHKSIPGEPSTFPALFPIVSSPERCHTPPARPGSDHLA